MFEPMKFVTLGLIIAWLAPFGILFWQAARFVPLSDPSRKADIEAEQRQHREQIASLPPRELGPDEIITTARLQLTVIEMISFSKFAPMWMAFYPHRWVGVIGLSAVAVVLICSIISLFVPMVVSFDP
jgi:hypothetical protein